MPAYTVTGPRLIEGVAAGGTVELDPVRHNIPALIAAGHVKPKAAVKPAAPPKEAGQ